MPNTRINGVILEAPAFGLDCPPDPLTAILGSLAAHIVPKLTVANRLDAKDISRVAEEVEKYKSDPMIYHQISLQTAKTILDYQKHLSKTKNEFDFQYPLLVCHGTADRMTSPTVTQAIYDRVRCTDKTLKLYDGAYHSLHYDLVAAEVKKDWLSWIEQHLA
jgi:alpha-beta hydrolase superfamily lysophospholipase